MTPVVGVVRVAAAPNVSTLLEVVDVSARHHLSTYAVQNGWLHIFTELAPAPLLLRHLLVFLVVPKHVLSLGTQAREDEAHGRKALGRFPVHSAIELGHEAFATLELFDFEPLLVVDVLDHAVLLIGESALRLARVALGVEVLGVAATALDGGVVEAVFVRALAEAVRHLFRKVAREAFKWKPVGFEAVVFEAVGFELGYTCVTLWIREGGGPIACLFLVSSLNLRKERRSKAVGVGPRLVLPRVTHVYPNSNRVEFIKAGV